MSLIGVGAWGLALGRTGIGAALVAAPERLTAVWIGPEAAAAPATQVLTRSLGVRDALIGAGTALALVRGRSARTWFLAGAIADLADLAVTAAAREHLPARATSNIAAIVTPAVALGLVLATRRRHR